MSLKFKSTHYENDPNLGRVKVTKVKVQPDGKINPFVGLLLYWFALFAVAALIAGLWRITAPFDFSYLNYFSVSIVGLVTWMICHDLPEVLEELRK